MTPDELMKPRYKVIAGYPGSPFEIGEIISWTDTTETQKRAFIMRSQSGHGLNKTVADQYPHLFKKLEWWQDRLPEDMPEYVKDEKGVIGKLGERYSHNLKNCVMVVFKEGNAIVNHFKHWLPATKDEYDNQLLNPPA